MTGKTVLPLISAMACCLLTGSSAPAEDRRVQLVASSFPPPADQPIGGLMVGRGEESNTGTMLEPGGPTAIIDVLVVIGRRIRDVGKLHQLTQIC